MTARNGRDRPPRTPELQRTVAPWPRSEKKPRCALRGWRITSSVFPALPFASFAVTRALTFTPPYLQLDVSPSFVIDEFPVHPATRVAVLRTDSPLCAGSLSSGTATANRSVPCQW